MTLYIENETNVTFPFDAEETARQVAEAVLDSEKCPYETEINLLVTDDEGIRRFNREYRQNDSETDVLSFPNIEFESPSDFQRVEENEADYFQPESGELILGDIIICAGRLKEQAAAYEHSERREFAFLVAHSMLHLCGYDHMENSEAAVMEEKQERVLAGLGITRDRKD